MLVTARQFWFFFIFIAGINILIHIFYALYEITNDETGKKQGPRKYKYGRPVVVNISQNMKTLYDLIICIDNDTREKDEEKPCPLLAPDLGPVADDKAIRNLFGIDDLYLRIQPGGIHVPEECLAWQRVAIVVPIHETHRTVRPYIGSFLYYIHPFLMKQQLEYQIFVILKPNATVPYKRGELFNIGFKEALAYRPEGWHCIIFHDAHLVPLDTRNLYRCSRRPKRLIADFQKPYKFGGVVAMRPRHFIKVNGFSNHAWSNDGDYIDMYKRLIAANLTAEGNVAPIGNYSYFEVLRQENYEPEKSQTTPPYYLKDGLSTVSYNIKNCIRLKQFYTLIEVEVEPSKEMLSSSGIPR